VVELAGGVRSPVAHDGDGVELIAGLAPDLVVVVADAGLGTINAVRTTLDALAGLDAPVVVHLNRLDPDDDLHRRNRAWLAEHLRPGDEGILLRSDLGTLVATISEARFRGAAT
jgi:dethiobiotin synthetase